MRGRTDGRRREPARDRTGCRFSTSSTTCSPGSGRRCDELWSNAILPPGSNVGTCRQTGCLLGRLPTWPLRRARFGPSSKVRVRGRRTPSKAATSAGIVVAQASRFTILPEFETATISQNSNAIKYWADMAGAPGWDDWDVEHPQCIPPGAPASYIFTSHACVGVLAAEQHAHASVGRGTRRNGMNSVLRASGGNSGKPCGLAKRAGLCRTFRWAGKSCL